jgi:transposase InsO family protein
MLNAKRIYRLYDEENLKVRSVERKRIARRQRVSQQPATGPNQCWAADFVTDKTLISHPHGHLFPFPAGQMASTRPTAVAVKALRCVSTADTTRP